MARRGRRPKRQAEPDDPVAALRGLSRRFGADAMLAKKELLARIEGRVVRSPADLLTLRDTLNFMRAYPDDLGVRRRVEDLIAGLRVRAGEVRGGVDALCDTGLEGTQCRHPYSYQVLHRLARRFPTCVDVEWDEMEDDNALSCVLELILTEAENEGMENLSAPWEVWIDDLRPDPEQSDLQFLLNLFSDTDLDEMQQSNLFELCDFPLLFSLDESGTGCCESGLEVSRVHYQKADIPRERFPLEPEIRRPLPATRVLSRRKGSDVIATCLTALCARNLEIFGLIWASPDDVTVHDCGRGVQVVMIGVPPRHRFLWASVYTFLVFKNGVPLGYGPASPFMACCEMGINLFPEFRGGEIRYVYSQVMRVLHHVLGVECFYLMPYGMGVNNPDAIRTGAFWFYRKLGFRCTVPEIEALARQEEERMRKDPRHRSSTDMLHRLSHTHAILDLSDGRRRPIEFGDLGFRTSAFLSSEFGGNRKQARRGCVTRIRRALGIRSLQGWSADQRMMLQRMAINLSMIPDLGDWSTREKAAMVRVIRAKAARSEARAARLMNGLGRLETSLRELLRPDPDES